MKNRKTSPGHLERRTKGGRLIINLVGAASIFAIAVVSIALYLVYYGDPMDRGRTQSELERGGSFLMEAMASAVREGKTTDLPKDNRFYPHLRISYPDARTWCFQLDDNDIKEGPDYNNLRPLEIPGDGHTVRNEARTHRIMCDDLRFKRDRDTVIIRFSLRHDLYNGDGADDQAISLGSAVKLRG